MENKQNNEIPQEQEERNPQPLREEKKEKRAKRPFNRNKFKRGSLATLMSVVFLAVIVVLNIVVSLLSDRFPSMNVDLTAQKLNSLSDQALEVAKNVNEETTLYLIGTEDAYRKDQLYTSYGLKYSQVANLAEKLQEASSKIKVQFVDPDTNPEFLGQYTAESLTSGKVLVKTEKRYKVLGVSDMFSIDQGSTGAYNSYSMVDSALASALEVVNMDKVPVVTVLTGHEELLSSDYLSTFQELMEVQNFSVQEVDFMTEEIPEDTQILMIPTPTTDYTEEELQKLRDYLNDETTEEDLAVLVTCHPTQGTLPKLAGFLEEWGVQVQPGVVAESDSSRVAVANASYILVNASEDVLSDHSYDRLVAPSSSPLTLAFDANNDISTRALWNTAASAYVVTEDTTQEETESPETAQQIVATMSTKVVQQDSGTVNRNLIVFGSSYAFTDTFLGTTAFSDRDYVTDLLKYATGTDGTSVTVATEKVQTNTLDVTASRSTATFLGLGVFTVGLPVLILAAGLVIFLKRRHL